MKRKIVLVSPAYPYRGGQALVESYLFDTLTRLGYDCSTVSFTLLYPSIFFPGTSQYETSGFVAFPHADRIRRLINSINPVSWIRAALHIRKLRPDAVVFVWWMPFFGPAYWTISKLLNRGKTRVVFLMENFISHEHRWFDKALASFTVRTADAFICQSHFVREQLTKSFSRKPVYQTTLSIYDCYDLGKYTAATAREQLGISGEGPVVLFFGLIRPYKGLDRLIGAFPEILKAYPGATLLVAGECYESGEKYRRLIREAGIGDHVSMHLKYIPNENVEPYFKAADVVCLPYYSATQSGIVMMAYGFRKPVVVTDVGGLRELVEEGKTGTVIQGNEPGEVATGVDTILGAAARTDYAGHITSRIESMGYRNLEKAFEDITAG